MLEKLLQAGILTFLLNLMVALESPVNTTQSSSQQVNVDARLVVNRNCSVECLTVVRAESEF